MLSSKPLRQIHTIRTVNAIHQKREKELYLTISVVKAASKIMVNPMLPYKMQETDPHRSASFYLIYEIPEVIKRRSQFTCLNLMDYLNYLIVHRSRTADLTTIS